MAYAEGRVGYVILTDGVPREVRLEKTGGIVTQDAHGRYTEAAVRNTVYSACTTAAATIGVLTLTGVTYHLYNPINSGVNVAVLVATFGPTSATFVVGTVFFAFNLQTAAPTGLTSLVVRSNLLTGSNPKAAAQVFSAATLAAVPVAVRPWFGVPAVTSGTALSFKDEVAGEIILPPGTVLSVQSTVAACAVGHIGMSWEEIPLVGVS